MISLYNDQTGQPIGEVSEADFAFLQANLEEEGVTDDNYYVDEPTVTMLRDQGASAALLAVLSQFVAVSGAGDVRWQAAE